MVGQRFGDLTVIGFAGRKAFPCGQTQIQVTARCDCGTEFVTGAVCIRLRDTKRCRACGLARRKARDQRRSVHLPSGKTIAQLAEEVGEKLDTLYHRWIRGWTEEQLSIPTVGPKRKRAL